jgi:hypothetical protein
MSVFGAYASVGGELTVVSGDEGVTVTAAASVGAGHHALGGWELTGETQFHTDGTWDGTSNTTGFHFGAEMDPDAARAMGVTAGSEITGGVGVYSSTDGGVEVTEGRLDTGRDYERESDDGHEHTAPTGDADFDIGFEAPDPEADAGDRPRVGEARAGATARRTEDADDEAAGEQNRIDTDGARVRSAPSLSEEPDDPPIDTTATRAGTETSGEPALRDAFDDITIGAGTRADQQRPEPAGETRVEATARTEGPRAAAHERPSEPELVEDISETPRVREAATVSTVDVPDTDTPAPPADRRIEAEERLADDVEPDLTAAVFEPNDAEIVLDEVADLALSDPDRPLEEVDRIVDHDVGPDGDQADGM